MKFKVKLKYNETLKLNFIVAYRSPIMLFLTIIGMGMCLVVIDHLIANSIKSESFPILQLVFGLSFMFVLPLSIVINTSKTLKDNKFISEIINYEIDTEQIKLEAESFSMSFKWSALHKIKEYKNWFLIYTHKTHALLIPKDRLGGEEAIAAFRAFFSTENKSHENNVERKNESKNVLGKIAGILIMIISASVILIFAISIAFLLFSSEFESMKDAQTFIGVIFMLTMFGGLFILGRKLFLKNSR